MNKQVDSSTTRNQGKTIDMQAEEAVVTVSREAKIFMPDLDNDLSKVPASISAEDVVDDTYRGLTLEALPIKGLKSFVIGIASIFGVMSLWYRYCEYLWCDVVMANLYRIPKRLSPALDRCCWFFRIDYHCCYVGLT